MRWPPSIHGSTRAQASLFRPEIELGGTLTRFLVDQIRTVDVSFIHGPPIFYLGRDELAKVEHALILYLGL